MRSIVARIVLAAIAGVPFVIAIGQQAPQAPKAEEVYSDIEVFKGVPAADLIPAMQFMSASMDWKCTGCHVENDYAADHKEKDVTRKMVVMQREINEKNFNGRLEVTCMTCHNKKGHPEGMPMPEGVHRSHEPIAQPPRAQTIVDRHIAKSGALSTPIVRKGTFTGPNEVTHKVESHTLTFVQAPGGKFRLDAGERKFGGDGKEVWYGLYPLADEPAAIFSRIGRSWVGDADFKGLTRLQVNGSHKIGKIVTTVVQGFRASTGSAEELYFDDKSGMLIRMINYKRSTIGTVASVFDYSNYKNIGGAMVPQTIVVRMPEGASWKLEFKSGGADATVNDSIFSFGG